ncbi:MAG TPA: hypothetical protein VGA20_10210 [Gemmatimonadales bacterium]
MTDLGRTNLHLLAVCLTTLAACTDPAQRAVAPEASFARSVAEGDFEVWLVDQSNSPGLVYGGTLYVYEGAALMGEAAASAAPTATIDLGAATASLCLSATSANPVRPHTLAFNSTHTHAILSFVASGHVVIFDAVSRTPLACLRMSPGAGGARQAHMSFPALDDSHILVANQNGKLLERIESDYATNTFTLNQAATLNLATCVTPNGVACELAGVRPDNAPICPIVDRSSTLGFVTLRGGGLFVVNARETPMTIRAEYDRATVHGNGCGGIEAGGRMYVNSGGGTAANLTEFDVYRFDLAAFPAANAPNTPAPTLLLSDDGAPNRDSHGMVLSKHDRYLWVADRGANIAEVFDLESGARVNTVDLVGAASADPTPDLADIAPTGNRIFFALRGPAPLTGDPHVATGSTPGLGIVQVEEGGRTGFLKSVVRISNVDPGGVQRADAHAVRVRVK